MRKRDKYKPAASRRVLLLLAGGLWCGVGIMLLTMAMAWLVESSLVGICVILGVGIVLGVLVNRFGLSKLVDRNLARILPEDGIRCLFGFMPWRSYLIIPLMIGMGIVLRHSSIPKCYLAPVYVGMGLALLLSGLRYIRVLAGRRPTESEIA
jgi:hypothetical protein